MARAPGQSDPVTLPRATLSSAALFQTGVTFLVQLPMEKHSEETPMKTLLSIIAFSLIALSPRLPLRAVLLRRKPTAKKLT
jgi:hypothetical protein